MSLFRRRKQTEPVEHEEEPVKRILTIKWDPDTKVVHARYHCGRKKMERTFHANSLEEASDIIKELWEVRED